MSKATHTPGPWRAAQINATDKPWAVIGQGPHGDEIVAGYLRTEADACLVAAALDLLSVARELIGSIADKSIQRNPAYSSDDAKWLDKRARAAVAKVENRLLPSTE